MLVKFAKWIFGVRSNNSPSQVIDECIKLLGGASSSIQIVSGSLAKDFYAQESILQVFENSKADIQILYGPNPDKESEKQLLGLKKKGKVTLYTMTECPKGHFMVVDKRHARIEMGHSPMQENRKAFIKYNSLFLAERLTDEFEKLKATATNF